LGTILREFGQDYADLSLQSRKSHFMGEYCKTRQAAAAIKALKKNLDVCSAGVLNQTRIPKLGFASAELNR
jgi:hypothetical protein